MPPSKRQQRIVLQQSNDQVILKVDDKTVVTMECLEAMSLGEAMFKLGADIKMKERQ